VLRINQTLIRAGALLLAAIAGSCGRPPDEHARVQTADSAGVQIVTYRGLPTREESRIVLATEPLVTIGGPNADPAHEFFNVVGLVRLSDGRIAVANGGSNEIKIFDPEGKFLRAIGGEGEGPGEFRALSWLGVGAADTLLAADRRLNRIQAFNRDGQYLGSSTPQADFPSFFPPQPVGVMADGIIIALAYSTPRPADGPQRPPVLIARLQRGSAVWDSLATIRGPEQMVTSTPTGISMASYTFGAYPDLAIGSDVIAEIDASIFGLKLLDRAGNLLRQVVVTQPPRPVTGGVLTAYVEDQLSHWPPGASEAERQAFRQGVLRSPHGAQLPLSRAVEMDRAGRVWVEVYPEPGTSISEFEVFDSHGDWLGRVQMPPGLDRGTNPSTAPGLEIGANYILGVWRDEADVETVRLYTVVER
jgi:6-bladed beta-propeller